MFTLSKTTRRLVSCLVLMLLVVQAMTQVNADVFPPDHQEQHCAGHDQAQDCLCCSDVMMMAGGCAAMCSVSIAVPTGAFSIPRMDSDAYQCFVIQGTAGPVYSPLNPPPIS